MNQKILIFSILIVTAMLCGCQKDVFDPKAIGRDYFIENIPEGFDWKTTSSVNAEITPNDRYNGQYLYTIEFFDKNPITDSSATLLGTGWCTGNDPLRKTITLPANLDTLIVRQTTPGDRKSVLELAVVNHQLTGSFAPQNAPLANRSVFHKNFAALVASNEELTIPTEVPQDAIEITDKTYKLESYKNYVISDTYTGSLNFTDLQGVSIYVKGTWNNTAEETKINTANFYIMEGGQLSSDKEWKIQVYSEARFAVSANARIGSEKNQNIEIKFENKGSFLNEGTVYLKEIETETANVTVTNRNVFYLHELDSENPCHVNNMDGGMFYIDDADIKNAIVTNQCYMEFGELEISNGATFTLAAGSAIKCRKLEKEKHGQTQFELYDNALFEVTEKADIEAPLTFIGLGKERALVKFEYVENDDKGNNLITCEGNLYIECKRFKGYEKFWKLKEPSQMVDASNGSMIDIPATKCSQGNDYVPEEPEQPEFPKEVTNNNSYTYTSEDNYPSPGDYDLNDLVVGMDSISYFHVDVNKVSRMTCHLTLRAVGATRQLGAAIQLDGINHENIESIIYSKSLPKDNFKTNSNGTEKDTEYAVIPLFDNAHKVLGFDNTITIVNTISENPEYKNDVASYSFDVTINFISPVSPDQIDLSKLNYFAIVGTKVPRTEIHLPKYIHTEHSNAPNRLQEVTQDYMWSISIPGKFRYSHEWISITEGYLDFKNWVQSGGQDYKDWYNKNINEDKLYRK